MDLCILKLAINSIMNFHGLELGTSSKVDLQVPKRGILNSKTDINIINLDESQVNEPLTSQIQKSNSMSSNSSKSKNDLYVSKGTHIEVKSN